MSDKSVTLTAHRALALPEIVGEILFWVERDTRNTRIWHLGRCLLNCALVNKTWCHEAIRILWSDMEVHGKSLNEIMIPISPDRRQNYANLVKKAAVLTYSEATEKIVQPALENVIFPQLHTLHLLLVFRDLSTEECIRTLNLNIPNLRTLHINYWIAPMFLYPDQWDYLTERISVIFPGLLNVRIEMPVILYLSGFEALSESLPNLESIEFEDIVSQWEETDVEDLDDESADEF
ncbi:uncharacterized protein N7479_008139 [Penicillium vulpinum]|uniref:F-box domain-containing protein n=1 Tax=Penicillium vulpinum TaxID=29845 RepID=A0A1V6RK04_9EURO|nr:uncharacterized protein N7479_008139 [Penicillium vulpinum]KAJ5960989.1 hypothetical protein N7479_008139 [Penicillium vulpinum]OQE01703.1 hypothetical protein PENVUL_c041G07373 [Penicillium vulpinum]